MQSFVSMKTSVGFVLSGCLVLLCMTVSQRSRAAAPADSFGLVDNSSKHFDHPTCQIFVTGTAITKEMQAVFRAKEFRNPLRSEKVWLKLEFKETGGLYGRLYAPGSSMQNGNDRVFVEIEGPKELDNFSPEDHAKFALEFIQKLPSCNYEPGPLDDRE